MYQPRSIGVQLVMTIAAGVIMSSSSTQAQLPPDTIMHYAQLPIEGVSSFTETMRQRVLADRHALDVYASLLDGTTTTKARWHPYVALYWLAESGDPKYVNEFLRFATPAPGTGAQAMLQLTQEVNQATDQVQFNAPVISTRTL